MEATGDKGRLQAVGDRHPLQSAPLADGRERFGQQVPHGHIRRLVAFQKAALAGVAVAEVADPRARDGWQDYQRIGAKVLDGQ